MFVDIRTPVGRKAGSGSGAAGMKPGDIILKILTVHGGAGGSFTMPDGKGGTATVLLPQGTDWLELNFFHLNFTMKPGDDIVFTSTDSWIIEYTNPGGIE